MDLIAITPLILTFNEAPNIGRLLEWLRWAQRVIVLDSGSTDETVAIARRFPNVRVEVREFDSHAAQWNYGVGLTETEWVLALDADYVVDDQSRAELEALAPTSDVDAFFAGFIYCVFGKRLRASLYPARAVLFRRLRARYLQDGHTQRLAFDGRSMHLRTLILHDDRKPLSHWLAAQDRYALLEARHLLRSQKSEVGSQKEKPSIQDRLRLKIFFAAPAMFLYLLLGRGLILDGWQGWFYVFQRTLAEILLSLRLLIEREKLEQKR